MSRRLSVAAPIPGALGRWLDGALWVLVFLLPIKFGGVVFLERLPANLYEWWLSSWPTVIAMAAAVLWAMSEALASWRSCPAKLAGWSWAPLVWLGAQWAAALASPWPQRAWLVTLFLSVCGLFFYIGGWPGRQERFRACAGALAAATVVVCGLALQQHFVTFRQTLQDAQRFEAELPAELRERMADLLGKLRQGRVFATLFYPNSLAGYLILVGAPAVCWLWQWLQTRLGGGPRRVAWLSAVGAAGFAALVLWCLLLTKSKGGFAMLAVALTGGLWLCPAVKRRWRLGVLAGVVALGALFFGAQGAQRGVETLEARADYWRAGVAMVGEWPWLGGGPGTFGLRYRQWHRPGTEWTRLAHNDFLQQWTDSGVVGFASYALIWAAALWRGARRLRTGGFEPMRWAVWVGLAAWTGHNLVDFDLYVAAVAWPAFMMAGWILGGEGAGDCS